MTETGVDQGLVSEATVAQLVVVLDPVVPVWMGVLQRLNPGLALRIWDSPDLTLLAGNQGIPFVRLGRL
jgi:hypothetical protein